jgi:hypothetical protein
MGRRQFQVITARHAVALDFYSALLGRHSRPFHVLHMLDEVWNDRKLTFVPDLPTLPRQPMPPARWFDLTPGMTAMQPGITDPVGLFTEEMMIDLGGVKRQYVKGEQVFPIDLENEFDVDEESAGFVIGFDYPDYLRKMHDDNRSTRTAAVQYYLRSGAVSVSGQGRHRYHDMMKRSHLLDSLGLYGLDAGTLYRTAMSDTEHQALRRARSKAADQAMEDLGAAREVSCPGKRAARLA